MNILLLGNGFDLGHNLPTKYNNFLHTVDFLRNQSFEKMTSVGTVFGDNALHSKDGFIAKSYALYKDVYDEIALDEENIKRVSELANRNKWFSYLLSAYDKDVGWIDFEREIGVVIKCFQELFCTSEINILTKDLTPAALYIIKYFGVIRGHRNNDVSFAHEYISDEYICDYPVGSSNKIMNKEKIVEYLCNDLRELVELLKLYLECFVDKAVLELTKKNLLVKDYELGQMDRVITLNYTSSFESIYPGKEVIHLHGELSKEIVLGVHNDTYDEMTDLNTAFIQFKKYYQRVFYNTDLKYLNLIDSLRKYKSIKNTLTVVGHSLDVTDKDIIVELFGFMDYINIWCRSQSSASKHIRNLVEIFGKEGFDELRLKRHLRFIVKG